MAHSSPSTPSLLISSSQYSILDICIISSHFGIRIADFILLGTEIYTTLEMSSDAMVRKGSNSIVLFTYQYLLKLH